MRNFIKTWTGREVLIPFHTEQIAETMQSICIEDIAHHLSQTMRYNGACGWPYSVAHHSLEVAKLVPAPFKLAGLLHDAAEAYTGDLVSPLKHALQGGDQLKKIMIGRLQDLYTTAAEETFLLKMIGIIEEACVPGFREVEANFDAAIALKFNLPITASKQIIKTCDQQIEAAEMRQILGWEKMAAEKYPYSARPITGLYEKPWQLVKAEFLKAFEAYGGEIEE